MAVYDNGTMDVRIDGKIVRRRYSINLDAPFSNRYLNRMQTKYQPELRDGEQCFFSLGDDIPTIASGPLTYQPELPEMFDSYSEFGSGR